MRIETARRRSMPKAIKLAGLALFVALCCGLLLDHLFGSFSGEKLSASFYLLRSTVAGLKSGSSIDLVRSVLRNQGLGDFNVRNLNSDSIVHQHYSDLCRIQAATSMAEPRNGLLIYLDGMGRRGVFPMSAVCWLGFDSHGRLVDTHLERYTDVGSWSTPPHPLSPGQLLVGDARTASLIARAILIARYGKEIIDKELPLIARVRGDAWIVEGSSSQRQPIVGGVGVVQIDMRDGRIVQVSHGR